MRRCTSTRIFTVFAKVTRFVEFVEVQTVGEGLVCTVGISGDVVLILTVDEA